MGSSPARPVFVVTGPSGAGKSMLEKALLERLPGRLELAVSATTRPRRPGEQEGREYWFVSDAEFDRMVAEDELLEWVSYVSGHRYGTPRAEIERIGAAGKAPLLDLETEGALRVRDEVPGAVTIFVDAPSFEELERRLRARATESAGEIGERLALARRQQQQAGEFAHVVVNDDLDRAADELAGIVNDALSAAGTMSRP
ncbi:MAG: guanylate kinase [Thermoleophilia bacterium]|nr:guanylate kinase [Thermoleophilia bacterium]